MNKMAAEPKNISVYDLLGLSMDQFANVAWIKLGLQPDPISGGFDVDLNEAKIAIDVVVSMSEKASPHLDATDRRELDNLVANLRMNFVDRSRA